MIKMIIFDLDGTLVNTLGGIAAACNHVLKNHGYAIKPIEKYMDYVGNGLAMTIFKALPNEKKIELLASSNTMDIKNLKGEPNFDIPELKGYINELLEFYRINPTIDSFLYEGVEDVLTFLDEQQIVWGIHTNKTASIAKDVADTFISPTRYIGLIGPTDKVPRKPNPSGSMDLIKASGNIDLKDILYVGDTEVDIETAKELGVPVISVTYGFRKKEVLINLEPDYIVDKPIDLIEIISNINNLG